MAKRKKGSLHRWSACKALARGDGEHSLPTRESLETERVFHCATTPSNAKLKTGQSICGSGNQRYRRTALPVRFQLDECICEIHLHLRALRGGILFCYFSQSNNKIEGNYECCEPFHGSSCRSVFHARIIVCGWDLSDDAKATWVSCTGGKRCPDVIVTHCALHRHVHGKQYTSKDAQWCNWYSCLSSGLHPFSNIQTPPLTGLPEPHFFAVSTVVIRAKTVQKLAKRITALSESFWSISAMSPVW